MRSKFLPGRAASVACCLGAAAAVGASPALATTVQSEHIFGNGSSLSGVAENGGTNGAGFIWNGWALTWHGTNADHSTLNCSSQPGFPSPCTATYTGVSSGSGLAEFGNSTQSASCAGSAAGSLDTACDAIANNTNGNTNGFGTPVLDAFVGTDDPPSSTEVANAGSAAGGGINEITIPVLQAPVTVVFSLPAGITIGNDSSGHGGQIRVRNLILRQIWNGAKVSATSDYAAGTWGALLERTGLTLTDGTPSATQFTDPGSVGSRAGDALVNNGSNLMVRSADSGTTYTYKSFLYLSGDGKYPLSLVNDSPSWPTGVPVNTCSAGCPFGANTGNGSLVKNTAAVPGSIGYANLADAAEASLQFSGSDAAGFTKYATEIDTVAGTTVPAHQVLFALIQDNYPTPNGQFPKFAAPQTGSVGVANVYTGSAINLNGSGGVGQWTVPTSGGTFDPTGSWSGTFASDPNVYNNSAFGGGSNVQAYPIVAVTYNLGWSKYNGGNLAALYGGSANQAKAAGATAASYLQYIASPSKGQTDLVSGKQYYTKLPAAIDADAVTAAAAINAG